MAQSMAQSMACIHTWHPSISFFCPGQDGSWTPFPCLHRRFRKQNIDDRAPTLLYPIPFCSTHSSSSPPVFSQNSLPNTTESSVRSTPSSSTAPIQPQRPSPLLNKSSSRLFRPLPPISIPPLEMSVQQPISNCPSPTRRSLIFLMT